MQLHNLQNKTTEQIAVCFNKAFEHYFVPLKLTAEQLNDKILSENIILKYSVGISVNEELAGIILVGINADTKIAYNAGTGVIPEYRGKGFTQKMYKELLPILEKAGIQKHVLEVICENEKALKIYQNLDYSILRKVICYKGPISQPAVNDHKIESIELPNDIEGSRFWNQEPTYQNSLFCIQNNRDKHAAFGSFDKEKLIAYIVFDRTSLRVKQFAVDKTFRNNGLGHQLFACVQKLDPEKEIAVINVDENDKETNNFLKKIGLRPLIEQYEMILRED